MKTSQVILMFFQKVMLLAIKFMGTPFICLSYILYISSFATLSVDILWFCFIRRAKDPELCFLNSMAYFFCSCAKILFLVFVTLKRMEASSELTLYCTKGHIQHIPQKYYNFHYVSWIWPMCLRPWSEIRRGMEYRFFSPYQMSSNRIW